MNPRTEKRLRLYLSFLRNVGVLVLFCISLARLYKAETTLEAIKLLPLLIVLPHCLVQINKSDK